MRQCFALQLFRGLRAGLDQQPLHAIPKTAVIGRYDLRMDRACTVQMAYVRWTAPS